MVGLIAYVIMSVIMSIVLTIVIFHNTDLDDMTKHSRLAFAFYFFVANLLGWPAYCIFMASYILYDHKA